MPEMAWFTLYVLYTLLFLLLIIFDSFYRIILFVFPHSYDITGKALFNKRIYRNSPKRVTEISEKRGEKCETYLTLKKEYLGNIDCECEKSFKNKKY